MEHIFKSYWSELGRPLEVYAELYGRARDYHKTKEASAKQGIFISLAVAFFIVTGAAVSFRAAEQSLKHAMKIRYAFLPAQSEARAPESRFMPVGTQTEEPQSTIHAPSTALPASGLLRDAVLQYVALGARAVFGLETAHAAGAEYSAHLAEAPPDIELLPGERQLIRLKYTNEGSYNWRRGGRSFISLYARSSEKGSNFFHDSSWMGMKQTTRIKDPLVGPGRAGFVEFYVRAPKKIGTYTVKFQLAAENTAWIKGSVAAITVRVVKEKIATAEKSDYVSAISASESRVNFPTNIWNSEVSPPMAAGAANTFMGNETSSTMPNIRVGLYRTSEPVEFVSEDEYELRDTDGVLYGQIPASQSLTLSYDSARKLYVAQSGAEYVESPQPLRLIPRAEESNIFLLPDFKNFLGRDKKINYNQFHGAFEIRFAAGYVWAIHELPIEHYLNGLAEAGEGAPMEFLKALAIAARSFAYEAIQNPIKHPRAQFHVDAEYDQIYKGVVREKANPSWVKAVEETLGMVVTYKNEPVTTPYFAQSAGRTRAWSEVWRGTRAWLVSVKTPYDKGRKRLGHGVGMSTHDALVRAKKGASAEEILKYYYRGTEVQKMW